MNPLLVILLFIYILDIMALLYFAAHLYTLVVLYLKNRERCRSNPAELEENMRAMRAIEEWPLVTIQLPIYNEFYVVERLIDRVVQMDYPKEKLHIQLLDDSTDDCATLARQKAAQYRKAGFDIDYLHRQKREGHKGGALKEGLAKAKGEFIAIFDADFLPALDFLKTTIPYFYGRQKLGMVQTRWGHINPDYSPLTKAQSIGIDGHFVVEHTARNGSGLWMNFNGTAGVWKKECIVDAGNWHSDTLTEDFDLSYRALLKGWKFHYLWDNVSKAEIPPTIAAFKSQQFRWCKGSIQTAKKLLPQILRAQLPLKVKVEAATHLLGYTVHPLILLNILLILPVILFRMENDILSRNIIINTAAVMAISTLAPVVFYGVSQRALYYGQKGQNAWRRRLRYLPVLTMVGVGIAINNTRAWLEAIFGKKSEFVRTPKLKIEDGERAHDAGSQSSTASQGENAKSGVFGRFTEPLADRAGYFNFSIPGATFLEIALGFYILFTIKTAVEAGLWFPSPFLLIYGAGFFYVAGLAISDAWRSRRAFKRGKPPLSTPSLSESRP